MKRLTDNRLGTVCVRKGKSYIYQDKFPKYIWDAIIRLSEYEDTGYEPEVIREIYRDAEIEKHKLNKEIEFLKQEKLNYEKVIKSQTEIIRSLNVNKKIMEDEK